MRKQQALNLLKEKTTLLAQRDARVTDLEEKIKTLGERVLSMEFFEQENENLKKQLDDLTTRLNQVREVVLIQPN